MYLFFDTETTGFISKTLSANDPLQARICQLAAILSNDNGEELSRMNVLIKPTNWIISPRLTEIHGISHQMAVEKGVPIAAALEEFGKMLPPCQVLVAHNYEFDKNMYLLECEANLLDTKQFSTKSTCCTMLNSTNICKIPKTRGSGYKWPKLQEIHKHLFGEEFEDAHDALADILATKRVFFEIMRLEKAGLI